MPYAQYGSRWLRAMAACNPRHRLRLCRGKCERDARKRPFYPIASLAARRLTSEYLGRSSARFLWQETTFQTDSGHSELDTE